MPATPTHRNPHPAPRSPAELARRYRLLQSLFGVPAAFMAELVAQEPRVLGGFGGTTLQAKFAGLAGRYGRFQDDVADMILVDPSVLINAVPAPPLGARSGVGSVSGSSGAGSAGSPSSPSPSASVLSLSSLASLSSLDGWELPAAGDLAAGDVAGDGAEEADAAERAEGDAGEAEVGARSGRRPGALAPPPPVLDQVLALSAATGVPLGGVLQLIAEQSEPHTHTPQAQQRLQVAAGGRSRHGGAGHELLAGFGAEQVAARLAALGSALGLGGGGDLAAVRATLAAHPRLLLLSPQQLAERLAAAEQLLAAPPGAAAITPAAATPGESGSSSAAAAATQPLPQRHPELLLLEPGELRSRVTALRDLLLPPSAAAASTSGAAPPLSLPLPPRLWSLLASQPGLLVGSAAEGAEAEEGAGAGAASAGAPGGLAAAAAAPPSDPVAAVREKLLVMQSLFEIPRPLVLELVFREPGEGRGRGCSAGPGVGGKWLMDCWEGARSRAGRVASTDAISPGSTTPRPDRPPISPLVARTAHLPPPLFRTPLLAALPARPPTRQPVLLTPLPTPHPAPTPPQACWRSRPPRWSPSSEPWPPPSAPSPPTPSAWCWPTPPSSCGPAGRAQPQTQRTAGWRWPWRARRRRRRWPTRPRRPQPRRGRRARARGGRGRERAAGLGLGRGAAALQWTARRPRRGGGGSARRRRQRRGGMRRRRPRMRSEAPWAGRARALGLQQHSSRRQWGSSRRRRLHSNGGRRRRSAAVSAPRVLPASSLWLALALAARPLGCQVPRRNVPAVAAAMHSRRPAASVTAGQRLLPVAHLRRGPLLPGQKCLRRRLQGVGLRARRRPRHPVLPPRPRAARRAAALTAVAPLVRVALMEAAPRAVWAVAAAAAHWGRWAQ